MATLVDANAGPIEIAGSATDIERIVRAGRIAAVLTVEGGHPIDNSLTSRLAAVGQMTFNTRARPTGNGEVAHPLYVLSSRPPAASSVHHRPALRREDATTSSVDLHVPLDDLLA